MKDEKVKIDPIDHYFSDLNKYPPMPQEKLNEKLMLIKFNTDAFVGLLSYQPEAQRLYVKEWRDMLHSGRRVHKMSKLTGKSQLENAIISNNINTAMKKVELSVDRDVAAEFIAVAQFNMATHYKVFKEYCNQPGISPGVVAPLAATKQNIIDLHNDIASANLKLVIKFAKEYQHVGVPLSDLIQEGNIGLMRAIEKFDISKGLKFTTYAVWWIKQGFLKAIKQSNRLIRIPTHIQETLSRISKVRETIAEETGIEPTMSYLAVQEGMNEEELETLYNVSMEPISIETVVTGEQNKQLKDFIPDTTVDLEADLDAINLSEEITKAVDQVLTSAEKDVIISRYGLYGQSMHTLSEIASKMNKSRERIRQLEASAKKKLATVGNLKGYY
jgi:RNA polymerase sigma factor (sigma-70 family)